MRQLSLISGISENNLQSDRQSLASCLTRSKTSPGVIEAFLNKALQVIIESQKKIEAVYPLLLEHLELLELDFIDVLRHWARQTFAIASKYEKALIANGLVDLGRIIWALPEGEPDACQEIAIACNDLVFEHCSASEFPQLWAKALDNSQLFQQDI